MRQPQPRFHLLPDFYKRHLGTLEICISSEAISRNPSNGLGIPFSSVYRYLSEWLQIFQGRHKYRFMVDTRPCHRAPLSEVGVLRPYPELDSVEVLDDTKDCWMHLHSVCVWRAQKGSEHLHF